MADGIRLVTVFAVVTFGEPQRRESGLEIAMSGEGLRDTVVRTEPSHGHLLPNIGQKCECGAAL